MSGNRVLTTEEQNQLAARVWGVMVFLRTAPPHKGEFNWRIFNRETDATVQEGYDCDITCAVFKAQEERRKLLRGLNGNTASNRTRVY